MNAAIWTLAEHGADGLKPVSFELLAWGRRLADKRGTQLAAVTIGAGLGDDDANELFAHGADVVFLAADAAFEHFSVEPYAAVLQALIEAHRPEVLIAAASSLGRTLAPYVAARVNAGLTADCTGLDIDDATGRLLQTRPAIGGNIMATIETPAHRPQMATVRPHAMRPAPRQEGRRGEIVRVKIAPAMRRSRVERVGFRSIVEDAADIQEARVIVAGGKGLKKGENLKLVRALADALGAAVGASREAVDRGWIAYPHQVGLSGKTVTPEWYLALGISGAIQHLAGMKTAEHIVAVNSDPDAQIFQVADLAVIGDVFEIVPALTAALRARRSGEEAS